MGQLVNLLKTSGTMTQGALAEAIYGDRNYGPAIYVALMALVNLGVVNRTGSNPVYCSLIGTEISIPERKQFQSKKNTEMEDKRRCKYKKH